MEEAVQQSRTTVTRFDIEDGAVLSLPAGAKLLTVKWHDGAARIWVANDPALPKLKRRVWMRSTGHDMFGDHWEYAGTCFPPRKGVLHVFVETV